MGSWSVYCEVSKIAITAGDECILLPIKRNKGRVGYLPYLPATLPIFGNYDDYGGLEDIIEDNNTKLIEEHFGITIDEFVTLFVDGEEASIISKNMLNYDELSEWNFMWINRDIYEFMSNYANTDSIGHLEFGNHDILTLIGFEHIGSSKDERFNRIYRINDEDFMSDGTWLQTKKGNSIFNFDGQYNALSKYVDIPEDKKWIANQSMNQLWMFLSDNKIKSNLLRVLGGKEIDSFERFISRQTKPNNKTLLDKYTNNIREYGDLLCGLTLFRNNLHCMSNTFLPYTKYITPQCGDHREHQVFLDKFSEINKSKIREYE